MQNRVAKATTNPNAKHVMVLQSCKTLGGWAKMVILSQTPHWDGGLKQWCSQNTSSKKVLLPYKKVPLKRLSLALAWARILLLFGCFGTGLQRTFCLAWARILLLFECFGTGLQGTCANGFGTSLAPRVPDKRTVFYGFQRWREAFCRAAFCLAWARILLLFECFGTGLQGTCANGFGTSLAPRVPDKRTVFYRFQRWREAFCRAAFCLAWSRILLLFECFGTGLQGTCANGFGTSLAPRVPDKRTVFYGFQRWREAFCRAAFCLAWARILLLFGCFGTGLQRTCSKATGVFPCKAICRDDVGATSDLTLAWARILLLFECFGTGLQGTCANGFGTRLAPRVPDKKLFFMGSKGDGKHFVGLRFAWHGLESCCCSSVSEPASKGLAPMVSEPASHRGCQTITVFYGFQRWREAFCRAAFCLAWARILLLFECFGIGLQGTCANGFGTSLAPRVPDNNCFLWVPKVTGSILSGCVLLGMGSNPAGLQGTCANGFGTSLAPRVPDNNCFLWVPKVTGSILSGCVLLGMGSNPAAVRVFRNRPPRDLRQWFRNQPRTEGARQKNCFFMGSKGDGKHFVGLRFAWHGLESCCCSSVSESASKGLAPMVSEPASHRGCQTITVFYGFQRWREAFCRAAFCLAWARILLLFGCFGIGLQGTCANGFGTSLAPRVPDNNCFLWVPKVTGSILSGCVLLAVVSASFWGSESEKTSHVALFSLRWGSKTL